MQKTASVSPIAESVKEAAKNFKNDEKNKVLIIGAGSSGMFAAYTLQYLGIENYEILEAHSCYGGRVRQLDGFVDDDLPLDEGAEWIHVQPRILQDLLLYENDKESVADSIKTIVYHPKTIGVYSRKKWRLRNWLRLLYDNKEHKFLDSTWFAYHRDYVYPYIADRLHLSAVVKTIDHTSIDLVRVTTTDGRVFEGSHVICALPVSILQQQEESNLFVPPMPRQKHLGWDSVLMAPGLKLWIEFDDHFYPDVQMRGDIWDFLHWEDGETAYFNALFKKPSKRHVFCLLEANGRASRARVEMDDKKLLATVLKELDKIFEGKASKHYVKSHIKNWSADPYIQGVYSYNGENYSPEGMLKPESNDRIYFCGEYLAGSENHGTVHGAAMSGRDAAQKLLLNHAARQQN